jgi:hypothetical protein
LKSRPVGCASTHPTKEYFDKSWRMGDFEKVSQKVAEIASMKRHA